MDKNLNRINKAIAKEEPSTMAELEIIRKLQEKQNKEVEKLIQEEQEQKKVDKEEKNFSSFQNAYAREEEWDVKIGDEITCFDPDLSYLLTGYRPITKDRGLDFDPAPFMKAGETKTKTGSYCTYPYGTKKYADYWKEQIRRCEEGYTVGNYTITGDNYFFLNFFQLKKAVRNEKTGLDEQVMGFPNFQVIQYMWFHYYRLCELLRKDAAALKPRGVGWSMIAASMGAKTYTTVRNSNTIYAAAQEGQLKPTFQVVSDELEFLNLETDGGLAHLKGVDKEFEKRSVHKKRNDETGAYDEVGFKSSIVGRVIDDPNKMRGTRVQRLFFEESGSNKNLIKALIQGEALVTINGIKIGTQASWGCVTGDNIVYKGDGTPVKIKDLKQEDGIIGFKDGHYNVEPITWMAPPAKKECILIHTNYGDIECSTDHPLYYWRTVAHRYKDNYEKRWREHFYEFLPAEEIVKRKSRLIGICNKLDFWGNKTLNDPYLIGLLIGDGTYGWQKTPRLFNCDEDVNNYVMSNYKTRVERTHITKDNKLYQEYYIYDIKEELKYIGIYGKTKDKKRLPTDYKSLTKKDTALLLAGIFDTDGCIQKSGTIELDQSNREILILILELLKKFGVWSTVMRIKARIAPNRKDKNDYWRLSICDNLSFYCFYKNIPIKIKYKKERLEKIAKEKYDPEFDSGIRRAVIRSYEYVGEKDIYNLTAGDSHTYLVGNQIITHNTGGDNGPQLEGLRKIFYDPDAYNILPFKNDYNEKKEVCYTAFFIPYYKAMAKFMDSRGVCDEEAARAEEENARQRLANLPKDLLKKKAEFCFTPEDVFMLEGSQRFDSDRLSEQMTRIDILKMYEPPIKGRLVWPLNPEIGKVDITKRPTFEQDPTSKLKIVEYPLADDSGIPYSNLYVAGVDSIDADESTASGQNDVSDFCVVVYKRIMGLQSPKIVAIYKDRPRNVQDAYRVAIKLCLWYNCQAVVESSRVGIISFFKDLGFLNLLAKRPVMTIAGGLGRNPRTPIKQYGVIPSENNIKYGNELIDNYIADYCESIEFREVVDELLRYSYEMKRKFDIVAALQMALIGDDDLRIRNSQPRERTTTQTWRDVGFYIDEHGYRLFGAIPNANRGIGEANY